MTTKQLVLQTVKKLPATATIGDAMEKLLFLAKIEKGISQAEAGKTISHSSVKARMRNFLPAEKGNC